MIFKNYFKSYFSKKSNETEEMITEEKVNPYAELAETLNDIPKKPKKDTKKKKFKYRITSPMNFRKIPELKHGTSIFCNEIPEWAEKNPNIVIEKL